MTPFVVGVVSSLQPQHPLGANSLIRYQCMVSDGESICLAVLPTTLSSLVEGKYIMHSTRLCISKCIVDRAPLAGKPSVVIINVKDAQIVDSQCEETSEGDIVANSGSISSAQASPLEQPQRPSAKLTGTPYTLKQISNLKYSIKNYTIRARVMKKTSIDCRAFAVNLHDYSGNIRAFIYAEQVDEFFPLLEVGNVYHISLAQIRRRNYQFGLVFNDKTTVKRYDEVTDVSRGDFDFVLIALLTENKVNHEVDILCVVKDVIDASPITTGTGKDKRVRRSLLVIDSSGYEVRITLWGSMATDFKCPVGSIVAFKGALIKDHGSRTLSASEYRPMVVNPDIPEAHTLRGWYDAEGRHKKFLSLSRWVAQGRPDVGSAPKLVSIAKANSLVAGVADNFAGA